MTEITVTTGASPVPLYLSQLNRHGMIAGATGTGKTVTLKVLVEKLSQQGIPTVLADIKGDLSGLAKAGTWTEKLAKRYQDLGISEPFEGQAFPVQLWDLYGQSGLPIRARVDQMGPLLLSRLLDLNDTQTGVLHLLFQIAAQKNWPLVDLGDLQSLLQEVLVHHKEYVAEVGQMAKQTLGAIQRNVLVLEQDGAKEFFGEPSLDITDFIQVDSSGKGLINILSANRLFQSPRIYSTVLIWLLHRLFEVLPEVGDLDKPKLVFFFDEAHLLFKDASKLFLEKVEQVVRLIRSKGVGIFFVTQHPQDLPETVLAQLGNRIQHALRAYTPKEIKAMKLAADSFPLNPDLDVETSLTEMATGEALLTFLSEKGQPSMVQRQFILSPQSSFDLLSEEEVAAMVQQSPLYRKYQQDQNPVSATELIADKKAQEQEYHVQEEKDMPKQRPKGRSYGRKTTMEKITDSFLSSFVRTIAREIGRSVMKIFRGK